LYTLYCQFLWIVLLFIVPLVFSNIYLSCIPYIASFSGLSFYLLSLWYSLTFICPVSCVPYIVSFSGLSFYLLSLWYSLTFIYLVYPILSLERDVAFLGSGLIIVGQVYPIVFTTTTDPFEEKPGWNGSQ
jgi:hypothetical protein